MGMFDSWTPSNSNERFLSAFEALAKAAIIAANAYAKQVEQPNVVVNVEYVPGVGVRETIVEAVNRAVNTGVQDRRR
jgi:hypothetical protein